MNHTYIHHTNDMAYLQAIEQINVFTIMIQKNLEIELYL